MDLRFNDLIVALLVMPMVGVLALVAWPMFGPVTSSVPLALLQLFIVFLAIPIGVSLIIQRGRWLLGWCVSVIVCIAFSITTTGDPLGCNEITARVAQGVCWDDTAFRRAPPFLAGFALLVRLLWIGGRFRRLG